MPELPEVETIVRELQAEQIIGAKIVKAQVFWPRTIATHDVQDFCAQIAGRTLLNVSRRGKFIVFTLSKGCLLVHLRMTGKFYLTSTGKEPIPHERARLWLDDGRILRYADQRKFGKWDLLARAEEKLDELGIEPLSEAFTLEAFLKLLKGRKTLSKPFLLNQSFVVGLGNIYVDEALWEAKIHPERPINTLTNKESAALHKAIPQVLLKGIANKGTSLGSQNANYFSVSGRRGGNQYKLNVFRQEGLPCPRCSTILCKIMLVQRGTHFCPVCQK